MNMRASTELSGRSCCGIDVQGNYAVVVRAVRAGGRVTCVKVVAGDASAVRPALQGLPAVGCLCGRESFARWVDAPFSNVAKARKVLPTLLDIQLPFALEDCICCFLAIHKAGKNNVRALAVAARLETVQKKIEELGAFGADPVALDQESLALWTQSLDEVAPKKDEHETWRAVVYLGVDRATLVVGQGEQVVDSHSLSLADVGQIGRRLRAQLQPGATVRWIWVGPGAADAEHVARLYGQLSAEWPGTSSIPADPAAFLARAVATRALVDGPLRCNLRSGALAHPAAAKRARRQATRAAASVIAAGMLLIGMSVAARIGLARRTARISGEFQALAERLAGHGIGGARGEHAIRIVSAAAAQREEALRPFSRAFDPSLIGLMGAVMAMGKECGLTYEMLSLSRESIAIRGAAGDWTGCAKLAESLKTAGYAVTLERKEPVDGDRIAFSISSGGAHE